MKVEITSNTDFCRCVLINIFLMILLIVFSIVYIRSYSEIVCVVYEITEIEQNVYSGYYKFNIFYSVDNNICKNRTKEYSLRNEKKINNIRDEYVNGKFHCGYDPLGEGICKSEINLYKFNENRIYLMMVIIIILLLIILSCCMIFSCLDVECEENISLEKNCVDTPSKDI